MDKLSPVWKIDLSEQRWCVVERHLPLRVFFAALRGKLNCPECGITHTKCAELHIDIGRGGFVVAGSQIITICCGLILTWGIWHAHLPLWFQITISVTWAFIIGMAISVIRNVYREIGLRVWNA